MDPRRPAWHTQQLAGARPMPLVVVRTPMGDHVISLITPNAGSALTGGFYDADAFYDAERFYDTQGVVLDESDRLISISALASSLRAVEGSVLGSYRASERRAVTVELHNKDRAMSEFVGREYVLRQQLLVYASFPTLDLVDAMPKFDGRITQWALTSRALALDAEEL